MAGVEIPFVAKTIDPDAIKGGSKAARRKEVAKRKWHNELIRFEAQFPNGDTEKFRLPRQKCDERSLQQFIFRTKQPFLIDYLQEASSGEIIYPGEALAKCRVRPSEYKVIPKPVREVDDAADKEGYEGSLALVLENVPVQNDATGHDVRAEDIREWLMFGIQEEDPDVRAAVGRVEVVQAEIEEVKRAMRDVPFLEMFDAHGKPLRDEEADDERAVKYQECSEQKEQFEKKLEQAKLHAQEVIMERDKTPIVLTSTEEDKAWTGHNNGTKAWYVSFQTDEAWQLEEWISGKQDWDGVKLALAHAVDSEEGNYKETLPPWAGRGMVPDGSKPYLPDYQPYVVNMAAVYVRRVEHGFGVLKSAPGPELPFEGPFRYYHGQFHAGQIHGRGVEYTDTTVFSGLYRKGMRWGKGRMDYCGGDAYDGDFGAEINLRKSILPEGNAYESGVPHGQGRRVFADGSVYEGQFKEGRITGQGRYESALGEVMEGHFREGMLQGKGYVKTITGETYTGDFVDGEYHGLGTYTNEKRGETYKGAWRRGQRSGRGTETFADGSEYDGYFFLDKRSGHGVLKYGKVGYVKPRKRRADLSPRTTERLDREEEEARVQAEEDVKNARISDKVALSDFEHRYEGQWLAGYHRMMGSHYFARSGNYYYTMDADRGKAYYPFLTSLQPRQERKRAKDARLRQKHIDLDRAFREEIIRKKEKVFRQQRRHARHALKSDHFEPFTDAAIEARQTLRRMRLENLVAKSKITPAHATAVATTNRLGAAALSVNEAALPHEEWVAENPLSKAVRSDFEELEERRRTVNLKASLEAARQKIIRREEAQKDKLGGGSAPNSRPATRGS
jgi:hypothetical protein